MCTGATQAPIADLAKLCDLIAETSRSCRPSHSVARIEASSKDEIQETPSEAAMDTSPMERGLNDKQLAVLREA